MCKCRPHTGSKVPLEAGGKDGELFMFVFVMCLLVFAWCQWSTVYSMSGFCQFCVPVGIIGAISGVYIIYIYYIHSCLVHARDRSKCWHCLCSDLQVKPTDSCGIFASCSFFWALRCWTFACRRSKQIRQPISTNRISSIVYH